MAKLHLPTVTLCAASDVSMAATIKAMQHCIDQVTFHRALLFTSKAPNLPTGSSIETVSIPPLNSREDYGLFVMRDLVDYIESDFALVVQWDGFVTNSAAWDPVFLNFDYIGAPWTDCAPPENVGNGGFSIRSKRLLQAGAQDWFEISHPEDICICRRNRTALTERGLKIADWATARRFSREREVISGPHFGTHGIFALAEILLPQQFSAFFANVDTKIIKDNELRDTVQALLGNGFQNKQDIKRCLAEIFHRKAIKIQEILTKFSFF